MESDARIESKISSKVDALSGAFAFLLNVMYTKFMANRPDMPVRKERVASVMKELVQYDSFFYFKTKDRLAIGLSLPLNGEIVPLLAALFRDTDLPKPHDLSGGPPTSKGETASSEPPKSEHQPN